jgi:FAD/FMN-containing dehydrogenase
MDLLARFAAIVGKDNLVARPDPSDALMQEPRGDFSGRALAAVFPKSVFEVAELLAFCNEHGLGVVPQGGNTGLVGGQTPDSSGEQILLSLKKLDRIREIDADSDAMTLEAGVTLARAQEAASSASRYFPLSLASEGSCTIGGNLATNAGGVHVLAYGAARDLTLGVEAVLADGRVLSTLSMLRKDNTGYDLTRLMIGSEGTLGVITAATLKLFPLRRVRVATFIALADPQAALLLLERCKARLGAFLEAFELLPRIGVEFVVRHAKPARDPFSRAFPWYALVEFAAQEDEDTLRRQVVDLLEEAMNLGLALDASIADSLASRAEFWRLREAMSEVQRREGGSIKHDVSLPLKAVPAFIEEAGRRVAALVPGARPVPFGHLGDGNIHYNISQPVDMEKQAFLARRPEVNAAVHGLVVSLKGSISAEHGIGQAKRALLRESKDPVALAAMRAIKAALDPKGVLNPGKLL